jgi:tetratricopeptide (TPR) repeat protein
LNKLNVPKKDRPLFLMARGTILQAAGKFEESSKDYIEAFTLLQTTETYSLSKGAGSMVINDSVQDFRGFPFERTYLHVFTAINHLATGHWENSAVEARRILNSLTPEQRGEYPEDAFSHYMAGFCLEMNGDPSNAALQYHKAAELRSNIDIDEHGGISLVTTNTPAKDVEPFRDDDKNSAELICFVFSGHANYQGQFSYNSPPYAEIHCDGKKLGRTYLLTDTTELANVSQAKRAVLNAAKTASRIAIKETVASSVESEDELLGMLVRITLFALEQPDDRHWETLPRYMQVARLPCPPEFEKLEFVFKTNAGIPIKQLPPRSSVQKKGDTFIAFCRDFE